MIAMNAAASAAKAMQLTCRLLCIIPNEFKLLFFLMGQPGQQRAPIISHKNQGSAICRKYIIRENVCKNQSIERKTGGWDHIKSNQIKTSVQFNSVKQSVTFSN